LKIPRRRDGDYLCGCGAGDGGAVRVQRCDRKLRGGGETDPGEASFGS